MKLVFSLPSRPRDKALMLKLRVAHSDGSDMALPYPAFCHNGEKPLPWGKSEPEVHWTPCHQLSNAGKVALVLNKEGREVVN